MASKSGPDIIEDGLVLCLDAASKRSYPGTGTVWTDLTGSNNGTLTNGPTFDADNGGSIVFDGSDDMFTMSSFSGVSNLPNSDFSACFWMNADSSGENSLGTILEHDYTGGSRGWSILIRSISGASKAIQFSAAGGTGDCYQWTTDNAVVFNTWQYVSVVYTYSSRKSIVFVDTTLATFDTSVNATGGYQDDSGDNLTVGNRTATDRTFDGMISNVSIYNRALTADEIRRNYLSTKERFA